jgi:NmrA-like family
MKAKGNTMNPSRTIAVCGATGAQGGGVVRALLARRNPALQVRALTRQPGAPRAQALAASGAEVAHADLDEPTSLIGALRGADAVFGVTNFWEPSSPERELALARRHAAVRVAHGRAPVARHRGRRHRAPRGPKGAVQTVGVAGQHLSGAQMAQAMAQLLRRPVRHVDPRRAGYTALGFPGAADLANMFAFKHDFNDEFCAQRNVQATRALHPGLLDFRSWLALHVRELMALISPQPEPQAAA